MFHIFIFFQIFSVLPSAYEGDGLCSVSKGALMEIKNEESELQKPVTVRVIMTDIQNETADDSDAEILPFSIEANGDIDILENTQVTSRNGTATFQTSNRSK